AGRRPDRSRFERDPGPRLRTDLRQGARPGPTVGRPVPGRAGGRGAGHGPLRPGLTLHFAWMQHVLVLNASYEPLNVTTVRRAHVLVFKGKARSEEHTSELQSR